VACTIVDRERPALSIGVIAIDGERSCAAIGSA